MVSTINADSWIERRYLMENFILNIEDASRCDLDGDRGIAQWADLKNAILGPALEMAKKLLMTITYEAADGWTAHLIDPGIFLKDGSVTRLEYTAYRTRNTADGQTRTTISYVRHW